MATPRLMFVVSRVRDPQKTSDALYNRFYDEDHLAAVLAGGHVRLGLRYKNVNANSAIGSPENLQHMEETNKSRILECDDIFDLIHFELKPYEKIGTYKDCCYKDKSGLPRCCTLICIGLEPAEDQDEDVKSWDRGDHLNMLGMGMWFRRCTRYKRKDGVCPRFMALVEYDCAPEDVPMEQILMEARATEWSSKISGEAKVYDCDVLVLIQAQGDTHLKL